MSRGKERSSRRKDPAQQSILHLLQEGTAQQKCEDKKTKKKQIEKRAKASSECKEDRKKKLPSRSKSMMKMQPLSRSLHHGDRVKAEQARYLKRRNCSSEVSTEASSKDSEQSASTLADEQQQKQQEHEGFHEIAVVPVVIKATPRREKSNADRLSRRVSSAINETQRTTSKRNSSNSNLEGSSTDVMSPYVDIGSWGDDDFKLFEP